MASDLRGGTSTAVFTVVSRNYLHFARVLMGSLKQVSPGWDRFVLLADQAGPDADWSAESFHVVEARELPIPEFAKFAFRYSILELNTAVKPWFFRDLFSRGYTRVVYLDPDIFVYSSMREVEESLTGGALAVLLPHLTGRLLDDAHPGEHEILQSGAYNLGFLALADHPSLADLLEFWCEKSLRHFVVDLARGLFTDQRWMDLVPGMFPDVSVLRHDGYDVAYWNLPHRDVRRDGDRWTVNGSPLVFFHFSGIDPVHPEVFSKHQNRYRLSTLGAAAQLARDYCDAVRAAGLETSRHVPYAYDRLRDGTPIPAALRTLYRQKPEVEEWAGADPFGRPYDEWNQPLDDEQPPLTRVMLALYQARPDIRLVWPDVLGSHREDFVRWFAESPEVEQAIPRCFIEPAREYAAQPASLPPVPRPGLAIARPTPQLVGGALRKASVALREGRLPMSPRRWLQLFRLHAAERAQRELAASSPALPAIPWPGERRRRGAAVCTGFYVPSDGEAAEGSAWMGGSASVVLKGAVRSSRITITGAHTRSLHLAARGVATLTMTVRCGETLLATEAITVDGPFEIATTLPGDIEDSPTLSLTASAVAIPAACGQGADSRELSVRIRVIAIDGYAILDFSRTAPYQPAVAADAALGLTVVGYISDGTGVAAGAQGSVSACKAAEIGCELLDARPLDPCRGTYPVSLLHVNADETPRIARLLGDRFFEKRYTIGSWAWELAELPDQFTEAFQYLDEIWAPSTFVQRAVAEKSPLPVVYMPYAVTVDPTPGLPRSHFGLPESKFLFLAMYDVLSVQERKNPLGVIEAFRRAFPDADDVGLVVRVNHAASRPDDVARVRRAVADTRGAVLIDAPLPRQDALALQASCDAFVSLHRSEGFGLNIAEAMLMGKPVVVTGWSGNVDFTNDRNACIVDYELVTLAEDHGPYRRGNRWADPDLDQAAAQMVRLVEDPALRCRLSTAGRATIATEFSPAAIGERFRRRIAVVSQWAGR